MDRSLIRMGQGFGLSWLSIVRKIVLPGAMPGILSGLRSSLAIAIILLVAAEMLGAEYGFFGRRCDGADVLAYCGFFQQGETPIKAVGEVAGLVLDDLRDLGLDCEPFYSPTTLNWIIPPEPESVKLALDRVLLKAGVDVLLHTREAAVTCTADRLQPVTLAGMEGRRRVAAQSSVDATGVANLSMLAELACRIGNERGHLRAASAPTRTGGRDRSVPIDCDTLIADFKFYNRTGLYPTARTNGGIFTEVPRTGEM